MAGFGFPEYGRLKRVLMHSPGGEIDRIGSNSFRRYLFEDAIDPEEFRNQHETLVATLRREGVEVVLLDSLLDDAALLDAVAKSPNLVYCRDIVAITRAGSVRMRMRSPVRRGEPGIAAAALKRLGVPELLEVRRPATMEGGDLIFLDEETLLVGTGNRTSLLALRRLWDRGEALGLRTVVAVPLPDWVIHLDGSMMVVDRDLAIVHPEAFRSNAVVQEDGKPPRRTGLLAFLRRKGFRFVQVTSYERRRRATNVITLGPRKLVAYAGNMRVRKALSEEGVEVIEIEGSELVRGGGGPRCMTAPVERDGVPTGAVAARDEGDS